MLRIRDVYAFKRLGSNLFAREYPLLLPGLSSGTLLVSFLCSAPLDSPRPLERSLIVAEEFLLYSLLSLKRRALYIYTLYIYE